MLAMDGESLKLIGGTLDLHAGQLVDRIGVHLGLPFPAGPHLEELARQGEAKAMLPASMADKDLHCHFSGAETQLIRLMDHGEISRVDAAREIYDLLARTVARMIVAGRRKTGFDQALVAGGVASSQLFRQVLVQRAGKLDRHLKIYFGKPEYSGDNAVGAALLALDKLRKG